MAYKLYTTTYVERREVRRRELELCLRVNSSAFDLVYAIPETDRRQTFTDLLNLARSKTATAASDLVVVANCDILFDRQTLDEVYGSLQANEVYCLTRWELDGPHAMQVWDVGYSQDAWIFRGPPRENIGGDFWFGVPGCDNHFSWELRAAGYELRNPSKSLATWHVHNSKLRTATNSQPHRVPPPYLYLTPTTLGAPQELVEALTLDERQQAFRARRLARRR